MQFLAGNGVVRTCSPAPTSFSSAFQGKDFQRVREYLGGRTPREDLTHFCNDGDLCNGTGRLS
jgi:hypothetical protein